VERLAWRTGGYGCSRGRRPVSPIRGPMAAVARQARARVRIRASAPGNRLAGTEERVPALS
jgi:hypothetical protein